MLHMTVASHRADISCVCQFTFITNAAGSFMYLLYIMFVVSGTGTGLVSKTLLGVFLLLFFFVFFLLNIALPCTGRPLIRLQPTHWAPQVFQITLIGHLQSKQRCEWAPDQTLTRHRGSPRRAEQKAADSFEQETRLRESQGCLKTFVKTRAT